MLRLFGKEIFIKVSRIEVEPEELQQTQRLSPESAVTSASTHRDHMANLERPRKRAKREEVPATAGVSTELSLRIDPWKIRKRLTASDLNGLSRLMLARKGVEEHVLPMMDEETIRKVCSKSGLKVRIVDDDDDTGMVLDMVFRHWQSSNSYVINRSWSKYVQRQRLKVDDEVGLRWDSYCGQFHICVLNRAVRAD